MNCMDTFCLVYNFTVYCWLALVGDSVLINLVWENCTHLACMMSSFYGKEAQRRSNTEY